MKSTLSLSSAPHATETHQIKDRRGTVSLWAKLAFVAPLGALTVMLGGAAFLMARLALTPPKAVRLASYCTSLRGRSVNQRHNARLAALALDGRVIAPGAVFSFNRAVKSWTVDGGYLKAPVSFDGELERAYGGGVCQASSTLYNAALLAGLPIIERHPHVFRPRYVAPGRDAAVAFPGIDLRFRNPHQWPIRIRASARGNRLEMILTGAQSPAARVEIATDLLSTTRPASLTRVVAHPFAANRRAYSRTPGAIGYRVVTFRVRRAPDGQKRRERLSDDTYAAMNRIVLLRQN